ncbi:phage head morphogenesis protein [Nocardia sp. ET3-3]|uniref:Phage head morphogenesis protein n=1 Tax=Nocardia terrae TaxID=2675851 RepID=A0A7K1V4L4_9NOCA|nr:phage head morphogenesis protein [Nocardia terrae]MVU81593.1 phage head morphogenesis protein [Nocardia terrae]
MITIADIDRWSIDDLDRVFQVCSAHADHCGERREDLGNLQTFQTWGGGAAEAAKLSVGKTRVDFDAHGDHVSAIATAASTASIEVTAVKQKLAALRATAQQQSLLIGEDGKVIAAVCAVDAKEQAKIEANRAALQLEVNQLLINAQAVDDDLAEAINGADGQISESAVAAHNHTPEIAGVYGLGSLGMPDYPDGSLTNEETRNYYAEAEKRLKALNDQLAHSDLTTEQRATIAQELRNEIRSKARELMADRDAAAALNQGEPNKTLDELVDSKMARKGMTREQALEDIIKSSSQSRGSVNASLGVDPENPKLPNLDEVRARVGAAPPGADPPPIELGAGSRALRIAGKAALPLAVAYEAWDGYNQVKAGTESIPEAVGTGTGAVGGMLIGAEYGATVGAFGGPVGVAVGGLLGGVIGGVGGGMFGKTIGGWFS